jgi:hypothetical protein
VCKKGFDECLTNGLRLWGVNAVDNPFYMKDTITTHLLFCVGSFFGLIKRGDMLKPPTDYKEDVWRTIAYYVHDTGVVRMNNVAVKTTYHKGKGGMNEDRTLALEKYGVECVVRDFPQYAQAWTRKNGKVEVRLKNRHRVSIPTEKKVEIPASDFALIAAELQRKTLPINEYRSSGLGRSQVFGVVNRRCLPADYSRWCWKRPYLYKLLLDFAQKHVPIPFTSITVNHSYPCIAHRDKNNIGDSYLVAFGDFTGGELEIHNGKMVGLHNIRHKPIVADFSKITHSVKSFEGERFSLVFYTNKGHHKNKPVLPPPRVACEQDKWVFYRGEEKIDAKRGLPHPKHKDKNLL